MGSLIASCQWISWCWLHPLNYGCTTKIFVAVQMQHQLYCCIYYFTTTLTTTPVFTRNVCRMKVQVVFPWTGRTHLELKRGTLLLTSDTSLKTLLSHLKLHSKHFFHVWNWEHFSKHLTLHWKHIFPSDTASHFLTLSPEVMVALRLSIPWFGRGPPFVVILLFCHNKIFH